MKTYQILALCFHYPDQALLKALSDTDHFREILEGSSLEDLQREYTHLFSLTVAGGIPPYETEYGHKDIFFKTQRLADISGFYRAFGMEIADAERIDFIGAELELMHWLVMKEERALQTGKKEKAIICRDAAVKFLKDHLGRWGGYFGDQFAKAARHPFYVLVGRWLAGFIEEECRRLEVEPERVTGWVPDPEAATEFECVPLEETQVPQPLTILK